MTENDLFRHMLATDDDTQVDAMVKLVRESHERFPNAPIPKPEAPHCMPTVRRRADLKINAKRVDLDAQHPGSVFFFGVTVEDEYFTSAVLKAKTLICFRDSNKFPSAVFEIDKP